MHLVTRLCATAGVLFAALAFVPGDSAAQPLDHFTCYRTATAKGTPKFQNQPGVSVEDRFRQSTVEVRKPRFICAPTNKNNEDPTAPTHPEHLLEYLVRPSVKFTRLSGIQVQDQFGTLTLDVNKPIGLKVPTAKSLASPPAALASPATDHFQCYGVRTSPNTPSFARQTVTIQDQFGSMTVTVRKPRRLCLPVDKNNESPGAEDHLQHLMCYTVRQASQPRFSKITPVFINNQFGPLTVDARRPKEVCVPALRLPILPTPTPTPTSTLTIVLPTSTPTIAVTATPTVVLPTPNPNCGNNVIDPGEDCDGTMDGACPGECTIFCNCPTCGDNLINQPNEECDGASSLTCLGECQSNCACPGVCDPMDPSVCLYPFPNDYFTIEDGTTDTGRRVHFDLSAMPRNVGMNPVQPGDYNLNDGFSPGASIVTRIPNVDLAMTGAVPLTDIERSFDVAQPVVVINADTLQRHLIWAEIDSNATTEASRAVYVRPAINFEENTRYIVAFRNMKDPSGALITPNVDFLAYRDNTPTGDPAKEARRAHMEDIFTTLGAAGIARNDLYLAWDFTTASSRNITERALFVRDDGFTRLGAAAPPFTVTMIENEVNANIFRRVSGTYLVERYVSTPAPGARFILDANGLPTHQATPQQAPFTCNIPRAAMANAAATAVPGRASIYGHGLLGQGTEISAGNVQAMGNEHNFIFCATDWIGMSNADIPIAVAILQDFSNFPALTDRLQQSFLNQLFLARLMKHANGFGSHAAFQDLLGNSVIDPSDVFYDGNSQGGIFGGALMALAQDITRGVLGVPGMNYSTLLQRSVDFNVYSMIMYPAYPNELERPLLFALVQMLWDRSDANGYAHHLTSDPLPGTPAKTVLLHEAFGDHQVHNVTTEIETRTIGASIYQPALAPGRHHDVNPFFGIPAIPSFPFNGSALIVWDSGTPTPPTTNTPPSAGSDPHGRPRAQVSARLQKSEFLKTGGAVIDVCAGAPCLAP